MSTRHERLSNAFNMLRSYIKSNDDARAFQMLTRIVNSEVKKAKEVKK